MTCVADGWSLPLAALAYALFTLLAVVGPAIGLLRVLRLRLDPAIVIPLGLALCAGAYWLSLVLAASWLFPLAMLALDATLLFRARGPWRLAEGPGLRGAIAPLCAFLALFALTQYPLNRCLPDGSFALDPLERVDTAFHVAVTWELANGYPPQVPGLAGVRLGYHFGPHLVRAAALRFAGVHPYDALTRFDLTLWAVALVLALRTATWALGAPRAAIALVAWTPLVADLSFVFARHADVTWWTELLGSNLLLALFFTNSLIPALALALGLLVCLKRASDDGTHTWLLVGSLLGLALPSFKIFLAAQLLLGLAVAFICTGRRRDTALIALPCLAATVALAWGPGVHLARVTLEPLGAAQVLRAALGLAPAGGLTLAAWGVVWTVTALGLRLVGLPRALRALRESPSACALGVMALCGWPLRWLLHVTADGKFDEAVYFSVSSGALLWIFMACELASLSARSRRPALVGALAAALCLPTSVQFLAGRAQVAAERVPPGVLAAMSRLAQITRPGEVVLQTSFSRWPPPPVVFVGRRVAYTEFMPYMEQFAPPEVLSERLRQVRRFFKTRDVDEARAVAEGLGARYVCVFGRAPAEETLELLEPVFESPDARLYRLPAPDGK
jgi:hypothetical protein